MSLKDFDAIIFDLDGVIIDTESVHKKAEQIVCRGVGLVAPDSAWEGFKGRTEWDIFVALTDKYGGGRHWDIRDLIRRKVEVFVELIKTEMPVVPGIPDFLKRARNVFRHVGLATSCTREEQQAVFARLGIGPEFDAITTGDEVDHGKPNPEIYALAVSRAGVPAADCLVIEDSDNGVRSAAAAGCTVAGITTSFPAEHLRGFGAAFTFDVYPELAVWLGFEQSV